MTPIKEYTPRSNSERTPRNLQMKCERTARKQLVKYGRSTNEFVNEPRGNGEKNKISSLEAGRKRRERSKSEPREYTPCGLPVRQSTAKQYRLTDRDKEYIKSFAVDGVVPLDAYLCALEHLPDQH